MLVEKPSNQPHASFTHSHTSLPALFAGGMLLNKALDVAPEVSEFAHHAVHVAARALTEASA